MKKNSQPTQRGPDGHAGYRSNQSSSATTVPTVGLVNAELLTLRQAIGVIMGANIGTTLTAYLIGFNLQDYALPILGGALYTVLKGQAIPDDWPGIVGLGFYSLD